MDKPYAAIVGLLVTGVLMFSVVAANPGRPVREITTYTVMSEAQILPTGISQPPASPETVVRSACNRGDSVTGGGYNVWFGTDVGSGLNLSLTEDHVRRVHIIISEPSSSTDGTQGWVVMATNFGITLPLPVLRVTAICLHAA